MGEIYVYVDEYGVLVFLGALLVSVVCFGVALYCFLGGRFPWSRRVVVWVSLGVLVVGLLAGGVLVGLWFYDIWQEQSMYRSSSFEDRRPVGCDELLKHEIVVDRDVDISEGMSRWVGAIQAENDHCGPEIWNPQIDGGRDPYGEGRAPC